MNLDNYVEWFKDRIEITNLNNLKKYLKLKGFRRYKKAYYLLKEHEDNISDKDIGELFKYEIRLRANITYYITMFEIYLRALLTNNFTKEDLDLPDYFMKSKKDLFELLEEVSFGKLVGLYETLDEYIIEKLFEYDLDKRVFIRRIEAVKDLRNVLYHHHFLLDYNNYDNCEINGLHTCDLLSNLYNFQKVLPKDFRGTFERRINNTDKGLELPIGLLIKM
ncbi:hypothetical protein RJG79_08985 [Mycoplasmatota bacterium WC44]